MGLLSIFKRGDGTASNATASEPIDAVQRARIRARQRLIGAVVLVIAGIIGFPLVFETQPRPIPVDIPIELPRKETAAPLVMPQRAAATASASVATAPANASSQAEPAAKTGEIITETAADQGRDVTPASPKPAPRAEAKPEPRAETKPANKPPVVANLEPKPKPANEPQPASEPKSNAADAARARDLLEGKATPPAASANGRFVVQVGAFADAAAAHETRVKVERLGLKTYTQVASTASGSRIRVRVGPFGSRDEADKAMAKARSAGLSAVVLTL